MSAPDDLARLLPFDRDPLPEPETAQARRTLLEAVCELIDAEIRLYSRRQVAELVSVSDETVRLAERAGRLVPSHRLGPRLLRYDHKAVRAWIEAHRLGEPRRRGGAR